MYEYILYFTKKKGALSLKELEEITGLSKEELQKYVENLRNNGKIFYLEEGKLFCKNCPLKTRCERGNKDGNLP